jgi:hypothetical protein
LCFLIFHQVPLPEPFLAIAGSTHTATNKQQASGPEKAGPAAFHHLNVFTFPILLPSVGAGRKSSG